jgi:uncharacterized protein (TIGR03437 family)
MGVQAFMRSQIAVRFLFVSLLAAPLLAQTQIGGGTCSSSSLNGTYAVSLTGRQVSASGTYTSVLQANGTATFDGLSTVNIKLAENTSLAAAAALTWSGNYNVQANCIAVVNITSGGSATLNVTIYSEGVINPTQDFQFTGSDATYVYSGGGIPQPQAATCSTAALNGVYTFNGSGYVLAASSVGGVENGAGLLRFDGQGNVTVDMTAVTSGATSTAVNLTGSYKVSSDCVGSATLADLNSNAYSMNFSIYSVAAANTNFYVTLEGPNFLIAGGGHTAFGQPAAAVRQLAQPITGGTCSTAMLNGVYSLTLSGRAISAAGNLTGSSQGIGTATFDGQGNVILAGIANTNLTQGQAFSYTGTYSVPSNCDGTLTITTTSAATFTLLVWNSGSQFNLEGSDSSYVYSGSGGNTRPPACAAPTLSGEYTFTASGFTYSGTALTGVQNETGVLQFDGNGVVTVSPQADGSYTVKSGCLASASLASGQTVFANPTGTPLELNFVISGAYGQDLDLLATTPGVVLSGSAHSAFPNPSANIANVASYAYNATPPGSIFVVFGQKFSARSEGATNLPLSNRIQDTSVTVNGEPAPLFYVSPDQIDAQMPWDIQGNTVASLIVTNGTSTSNAAAVYVPASGTPGISSTNNRAPVVNADGSVNSPSHPAKVGDEVVVYFTGGGPVQASGPLMPGHGAPAGESPVTGNNSVTVGGVTAKVVYMGLTAESVGLYQANFIVPSIPRGVHPVVITIAGYTSNNPVMNVSN